MIRERSVIFIHSASPINNSLRSKRFRLVSEPKNRPRNGISVLTARQIKGEPKNERGGRGRGRKKTPLPPRSFTCAIFRAVFDSCSSFFASKPHSNACYSGYLVGNSGGRVGATPDNGKLFFPTMAKSCT